MLSFFRRIINSRVGFIVTFVVLGVIALAFAAGDVTNLSTGSGGLTGNDVAKVGGKDITVADLTARANDELQVARQQQPTLDMAGFVAAGGLDGTLQRLITTTALQQFGHDQGMVVSKRAVDGQIASIPALQGPNGQFDETLYRRILAERKLTDKQVRADIVRDTLVAQLTGPTIGAAQVPQQVAIPYASLLLEKRAGLIGFVPAAIVPAGPAPTDAELQTFYGRNLNRYSVPERRTIRYAVVTPAMVAARAKPTDAEIAQAYNQNKAQYQPTEKRTIRQVIVLDQAGATALAAKVRAGTPIAAAATQAGLEAALIEGTTKIDYAKQADAAIADQVFAAAANAVVGPVKGPLGFVVARVESIQQVPGRTLAQARDDIVVTLSKQKGAEAMSTIHDKMDDALVADATFDEVVKDQSLQPQTTPAVTAQGVDPLNGAKIDPALTAVVTAAFTAADGDPPQLVQTNPDGSFAVVAVGAISPAAPRPLAQIRDRVVADFTADRRRQAARRLAGQVLAKVNGGTALPQALAAAGAPAARPISATRAQLAQAQGGAEPALALMFSMAKGSAKLLEAPQGAGWLIVKLNQVERADASRNPAAIAGARGDISRLIGRELAEQFARAARSELGVKTDSNALARVRKDLSGTGN
ncbi:SurA N-terminal domain-containing protein [Microvirga sp. SRT01]|uniref:SurA N-terminal domain-containing protein n=1 Tax=Sphingomonas longa TaxID=2778730 RepID=A0ABS2D2Q3_9SPHN|nr:MULTISPECIES: peptidylprolyl isomerase [Alphaproteobacteria]MBM6575190.1 SurA N-terminal domain-containing protein [Sphingomonas sp. BT552]MBR7708240.1 SurA N-terminal domain-containing protein [Microvirga sp. SRT01]